MVLSIPTGDVLGAHPATVTESLDDLLDVHAIRPA